MCCEWSKAISTSCSNWNFPVTFIKLCPITIQNNMHWWWIEINEIPKYKFYGNIGGLSKTTCWYHSNDTKRNSWVVLCSHFPVNDSPAIYTLPFTLRLCYKPLAYCRGQLRVKRFIYQVMMNCKNFIKSTFLDIGPKGFSVRGQRKRNFLLPPLLF